MQLPYHHSSGLSSATPDFPEASGRAPVNANPSARIGMAARAARVTWGKTGLHHGPVAVQEKRRRRRVAVPQMYSSITLRNLALRTRPIEGYVVDLSENGLAIEADSLIPVGQVVTVEFQIAGVGSPRQETWPQFAAAAEVVRHDNLDDFPGGPYRIALRFVKMSTMAQAQIARFVATQPG